MPPGSGGAQQPSVLRATLDNGLQVIIVRDPLAPIVTQQLTFFAGANESPDGFPGMAHAQEHMMFRGSPGLTGDQINDITAQLGGDSDAFTASDATSYYFTVPADDLDVTLQLDAIRLAGVNDDQADWETERGAIEQEVAQDNSNPLYVLEARARERIFAGTPYANTGLGTKDSFDKTTADMLKRFWDTWYAPNNALLVLAGDVDPQPLLARVRELYGKIPRKTLPPKPPVAFQQVTPETFSSTTDQPYGIVAYIFRMPGYRDPDYAASRVLSDVLDSARGPISALSFEGKALGSGFVDQTLEDAGFAIAYAAFPSGADEKTLAQQLKDAITQAASHIAPDLIEAQRTQVLLDSALRADSVSGLAQAWTNAVAVQGLDSPDQAVSMIRGVDAKAVNDTAARLIDFNHALTLVLTPSGNAEGGGGQVFGSAESFASTPQGAVQLPPWAEAGLARLPHPNPLFTPTVFDLPNGIHLIVQRLPTSGAVSLYGRVHTDETLQAPQGQDGVSDMLNTLFEWGPTGMSRSDFEAAFDKIGANYSTGTSFSLQTLPESFDKGLELLAKDLLDPALPADAFNEQKPIQVRQAASNAQSPVSQFRLEVQKGLVPAGDPSLRRATAQTVSSLTLDAVRAYYKTVMRPDETTIVVVGDMDPQAVRTIIIQARFGAWKAIGPKPNLEAAPVPPSAAGNAFVSDPVREQDQVVLAETLPLTYNDPDHYALALGNIFLGGDSFANPLYRELRVKRGLVYSVGSSAGFSKTRGEFSIDYGAYPEKVLEAKQLAIQTLQTIADQPLSDQDLHLAKAQALRQIELTSQNASDIADNWLGYGEEGLPLDRLFQVASRYESVTAAEIQAAFKKYVDPGRLSTFILGKPVN